MKNSHLIFFGALAALGGAIQLSACSDRLSVCQETETCPRLVEAGGAGAGTGGADGGGGSSSGGDGGSSASDECNPACEGATPVCDSGTCVGCVRRSDCNAPTPVCDTEAKECVGCLENGDCSTDSRPLCGADGTCEACTDDASCGSLGNRCLPTGQCVECTPQTDDRESDTDDCATGVCHPETNRCEAALPQNTKDVCASCIADSECLVGSNCIPLRYTGGVDSVELGGFCMKLFPGCTRPFAAGSLNRESVSGAAVAEYCGLDESRTTCAAISDLAGDKDCAVGSDCGTGNGDGRCDVVNGSASTKCTYSCTSSNQCVTGNDCDGPFGSEYCGG